MKGGYRTPNCLTAQLDSDLRPTRWMGDLGRRPADGPRQAVRFPPGALTSQRHDRTAGALSASTPGMRAARHHHHRHHPIELNDARGNQDRTRHVAITRLRCHPRRRPTPPASAPRATSTEAISCLKRHLACGISHCSSRSRRRSQQGPLDVGCRGILVAAFARAGYRRRMRSATAPPVPPRVGKAAKRWRWSLWMLCVAAMSRHSLRHAARPRRHHHRRLICRAPAAVLAIVGVEPRHVQLSDGVQHRPHQIVLRRPAITSGGITNICSRSPRMNLAPMPERPPTRPDTRSPLPDSLGARPAARTGLSDQDTM